MRDPYKILGVPRDAGADQIKAAWRSKAKAVHPDHNQGDPTATARFAEMSRAYETLKDPKKRSRFDQLTKMAEAKEAARSGGQTIMQQRQAAREAAERDKAARANAEKVMEELARATAQKAAAAAAAEARATAASQASATTAQSAATGKANTQASTAQAANARESAEDMVERIFGAKAAVEAEAAVAATTASANAGAATEGPAAATASVGVAAEEKRQEASKPKTDTAEQPDDIAEAEPMLAVGGIGALIGRPSLAMLSSLVRRFTGQVAPSIEKAPDIAAEATVTVADILKGNWIPVTLSDGREVRFQAAPGISDGQIVRLKSQGLKLQGMQRGDVAITVHVETESRFTVKGLDVHMVLPLTIENAVLGCTTTVEGPNGEIEITVPAWSGSDHTIRIEGAGLAEASGAKGDLVVELRLLLWEKPDDKMTDLMRSMKNGLFL